MYYIWWVWDEVDWSHRGDYMHARHGIKPSCADEALVDPDRVMLDPDPASKSGRGVWIIGWSSTAGCLVTVLVFDHAGTTYGVNGWRSNTTDLRRYREGTP